MKTVLIADDESLFLASLSEGLAAFSSEFVVVTAANGREAADILDSRPIDLVVTDLKMPTMDGFQLLAYMSRYHPLVPAIVMTAFGTPSIEDQLKALDAFGYLEKPIDFQTLTERIREGLDRVSRGHIRGITLFSFLQLLNIEKKTCCVGVTSKGREGFLYLVNGELADARLDDTNGEAAAFEIVCWDEAEIELVDLFRHVDRRINSPLPNILMDAAQMKDEKGRDGGEPELELDIFEEETPEETSFVASKIAGSLDELMRIDGALAVALVDVRTGRVLAKAGGGLDLDVAAAGNSQVLHSKFNVMRDLGIDDTIEDILITLESQYHLIRLLAHAENLFLYLVLDRSQANLGMARHKLTAVEPTVAV